MSKLVINNVNRNRMSFEFEDKHYTIPSSTTGVNPETVEQFKDLGFELYTSMTWPANSVDLLLVLKNSKHNITQIEHKSPFADDIAVYSADADFYREQLSDKDKDGQVIKFENIQPHYISSAEQKAILKLNN